MADTVVQHRSGRDDRHRNQHSLDAERDEREQLRPPSAEGGRAEHDDPADDCDEGQQGSCAPSHAGTYHQGRFVLSTS